MLSRPLSYLFGEFLQTCPIVWWSPDCQNWKVCTNSLQSHSWHVCQNYMLIRFVFPYSLQLQSYIFYLKDDILCDLLFGAYFANICRYIGAYMRENEWWCFKLYTDLKVILSISERVLVSLCVRLNASISQVSYQDIML